MSDHGFIFVCLGHIQRRYIAEAFDDGQKAFLFPVRFAVGPREQMGYDWLSLFVFIATLIEKR